MNIRKIENEIDAAFEDNILTLIPYSQSIWELLSYLEHKHYELSVMEGSIHDKSACVDNMINFITHPLRVCFKMCTRRKYALKAAYSQFNANAAHEWYGKAYDYNNFCSIFPLVHRKELSLDIKGYDLKTNKDLSQGVPYEAYNRFVHKTGANERSNVDTLAILDAVREHTFYIGTKLAISWTAALSKLVISIFKGSQVSRYHLPESWKFSRFTFGEFREIAIAISALSYARYAITTLNAEEFPENGYSQRVWLISKNEFIKILIESTELAKVTVMSVLEYLTFGSKGINYPDAATQPLFDLEDGNLAISPFLFINSDVERNACALFNQIEEDKAIYSSLVDDKEKILFEELKDELAILGYRCESGKVSGTDLDMAIIDDENRFVLTVELKWFIEPAEIREVNQRSQEITKGINQAKVIRTLLESNDENLYQNILKIDSGYKHCSIVGSFNLIGYDGVQDEEIPVIKVGNLMSLIKSCSSLSRVAELLNNRQYLPVPNKDYNVVTINIQSGNWNCKWYGLKSLVE
ncbi:hypothetical protein [Photobacterium leiognathi]|uniref:hypothetical protein n=1 Tax=Photobacterium leiognathi TaxID=553611 RepID=UPI00273885D7|nr:hypothetical protein [Photobacterium leiognathi]